LPSHPYKIRRKIKLYKVKTKHNNVRERLL
jgi:hypothetical protein